MSENSVGHAPYNFIPFSERVLVRYDTPEDLPGHDVLDPSLLSGEIRMTLTARTPVFVSDGAGENPRFFRDGSGRFCIPGSTVRGLARVNMQILGFGLIRPGEDLQDCRFCFRKIFAPSGSVDNLLWKRYREILGVAKFYTSSGKSFFFPTRVRSGYLVRIGETYVLRPTDGPYLRVPRSHPDAAALGDEPARAVPVAYTASGGEVLRLLPAAQAAPDMKTGTLLFTGKPAGRSANPLYLFPAADPAAPTEEISPEDALSYAEDWRRRKSRLSGCYDPAFWALPEAGEEKPVFSAQWGARVFWLCMCVWAIATRCPRVCPAISGSFWQARRPASITPTLSWASPGRIPIGPGSPSAIFPPQGKSPRRRRYGPLFSYRSRVTVPDM